MGTRRAYGAGHSPLELKAKVCALSFLLYQPDHSRG